MNHLVDGTEPGPDGVRDLVQRALALRAGARPAQFPGMRLGAIFLAPSLRTRTSVEAAAVALGMHPIVLQPGRDSWGWATDDAPMTGNEAEHIKEAIPVLSGYVDLLAVRAFAGLTDREADREDRVFNHILGLSRVPVVNLESARWHPMQGFADTATWTSQLGADLRGKRLALTWAPHPRTLPQAVPQQVLLSAALMGMDVTVHHPEGFSLDPDVVGRAAAMADAGGGRVQISHDPDLGQAQVVYAKNWSGFEGYEDRDGETARRAQLGHWKLTAERLGQAGFMHCLPVRRGVVVDADVLDGPRSWVQEQANFRLWTAMAALERVAGGAPWNG